MSTEQQETITLKGRQVEFPDGKAIAIGHGTINHETNWAVEFLTKGQPEFIIQTDHPDGRIRTSILMTDETYRTLIQLTHE